MYLVVRENTKHISVARSPRFETMNHGFVLYWHVLDDCGCVYVTRDYLTLHAVESAYGYSISFIVTSSTLLRVKTKPHFDVKIIHSQSIHIFLLL